MNAAIMALGPTREMVQWKKSYWDHKTVFYYKFIISVVGPFTLLPRRYATLTVQDTFRNRVSILLFSRIRVRMTLVDFIFESLVPFFEVCIILYFVDCGQCSADGSGCSSFSFNWKTFTILIIKMFLNAQQRRHATICKTRQVKPHQADMIWIEPPNKLSSTHSHTFALFTWTDQSFLGVLVVSPATALFITCFV